MANFKKLLSFVLTFAMLLTMASFPAFAANPTLSLSVDKTQVNAGETVKVTVSVSNNVGGICASAFALKFDADKFDVVLTKKGNVKYTVGDSYTENGADGATLMGSQVNYSWADATNYMDNGEFVTFEFTAKESVNGTAGFYMEKYGTNVLWGVSTGPSTQEGVECDLTNPATNPVTVQVGEPPVSSEESSSEVTSSEVTSSETTSSEVTSSEVTSSEEATSSETTSSEANPNEIVLVWDSAANQFKLPADVTVYVGDTIVFDVNQQMNVSYNGGTLAALNTGRRRIHYDLNNNGTIEESEKNLVDSDKTGEVNDIWKTGKFVVTQAAEYQFDVSFFNLGGTYMTNFIAPISVADVNLIASQNTNTAHAGPLYFARPTNSFVKNDTIAIKEGEKLPESVLTKLNSLFDSGEVAGFVLGWWQTSENIRIDEWAVNKKYSQSGWNFTHMLVKVDPETGVMTGFYDTKADFIAGKTSSIKLSSTGKWVFSVNAYFDADWTFKSISGQPANKFNNGTNPSRWSVDVAESASTATAPAKVDGVVASEMVSSIATTGDFIDKVVSNTVSENRAYILKVGGETSGALAQSSEGEKIVSYAVQLDTAPIHPLEGVRIDFTENYYVQDITLKTERGFFLYDVFGSTDGTNWYLISCDNAVTAGNNTYKIAVDTVVKYLRVDARDFGANWSNNKITLTSVNAAKNVEKQTPTVAITADLTKDFDGTAVALESTGYTYDGDASAPTITYHKDNAGSIGDALEAAPSAAGKYWVKVAFAQTNAYNAGSAEKAFEIKAKELAKSDFTVDELDKTFTGKAIENSVALAAGGVLTTDDYTVAYTDNTKVGEATITITGKNNAKGTLTYNFNIVAKTLVSVDFTVDVADKEYTGAEIKPEAVLSTVGTEAGLTADDFTVSFENNTAVGTAKLTLTGKNNATGTVDFYFDITARTLTKADFTVDETDKEYTGSAIEPTVTPVISTLEGNFDVAYTNNTDKGQATITITGKNNATGTLTYNFNITNVIVSKEDFELSKTSVEFVGTEIRPTVTSKNELITSSDFDVTYSDNINAGTATVTITGKNNAGGTTTLNFTITPKAIVKDNFVVDETAKEYTGSVITPSVELTPVPEAKEVTLVWSEEDQKFKVPEGTTIYVGDTLKYNPEQSITAGGGTNKVNSARNGIHVTIPGTSSLTYNWYDSNGKGAEDLLFAEGNIVVYYPGDHYTQSGNVSGFTFMEGFKAVMPNPFTANDYEVEYSANKDAGTAAIIIKGKNNAKGSLIYNFTINPKALAKSDFTVDETAKDFTGTEIKPAVAIANSIYTANDYEVAYSANTNAGTATVSVTGKNNATGTVTYNFTINPVALKKADFTVDTEDKLYTGSAIEPTVALVAGGLFTTEDYTVAYTNNVEEGQATITITGKRNASGTLTYNFNIYNTVTVTFKAIDSETKEVLKELGTQVVNYGANATLPELPAIKGYENTTPEWDNNGEAVKEDITINALYTKNEKGDVVNKTEDAIVVGNLTDLVEVSGEEQAEIDLGRDLEVWLEVDNANPTKAEKAAIEKAAGNHRVGKYLALDFYKQLTFNGEAEGDVAPATINGTVSVVVDIPNGMLPPRNVITRHYSVVKLNADGSATVVNSKYSIKTKTIVFDADASSTYAIAYKDVKSVDASTGNDNTVTTKPNVSTGGDVASLIPMAMIALISLAGFSSKKR